MVLRLGTSQDAVSRWRRRTILRFGFLGAVGLAATEIAALVTPFIRVNRVEGLGSPVAIGTKASLLQLFATTNDRPILFREGRFFLLHAPGGIIAAYRKCTHLGCAVPWSDAEDRFTLRATDRSTTSAPPSSSGSPHRNRCSSFTSPRAPTVSLSSTRILSGSSIGEATGIHR